MASLSVASSGSSQLANSGSEEDLLALINRRKQKRMLSNRESARRSRMRKQNHLDNLVTHVSQLKRQNEQIVAALHVTAQNFCCVEAENSVLRTQVFELTNRLQSLNEILCYINGSSNHNNGFLSEFYEPSDSFVRPWNSVGFSSPITASADVFPYC